MMSELDGLEDLGMTEEFKKGAAFATACHHGALRDELETIEILREKNKLLQKRLTETQRFLCRVLRILHDTRGWGPRPFHRLDRIAQERVRKYLTEKYGGDDE